MRLHTLPAGRRGQASAGRRKEFTLGVPFAAKSGVFAMPENAVVPARSQRPVDTVDLAVVVHESQNQRKEAFLGRVEGRLHGAKKGRLETRGLTGFGDKDRLVVLARARGRSC